MKEDPDHALPEPSTASNTNLSDTRDSLSHFMKVTETPFENPEVLVDTEWVSHHLNDSNVQVTEVDYDPLANYYRSGHISGAVIFDWKTELNDPITRDILSMTQLEELLGKNGITGDTTIVLYGDLSNWFATFAFWGLKYYGVEKVKLMNGGRKKWLLEGRPITKDVPTYPVTVYKAKGPDENIRAYKDYVLQAHRKGEMALVDVRSAKEFTGKLVAPPEYPYELAQRGGHIPGAVSIPWDLAVNDTDGTFKRRQDLEQLYGAKGITPEKEIITYCTIGERSSHIWFVLKYLLGYPNVRNYDGSWTEWGNSVKFPIEK
jgi:thiosulfate/3-mercaptopyruvate sulfurtransferase